MLEIKSQLDLTAAVKKGDLRKLDGKLIVDIQGEIEIFADNKLFFYEASLAVLEFACCLKEWDRKRDLFYYTLEHDDSAGPILAFLHERGDMWKLQSIWQEYEMTASIIGVDMRNAVETFLENFNKELEKQYHFTLERFLRRR